MTDAGIDLKRLALGSSILLETDASLYELEVLNPALGLVEISSTDPALRPATVGQFVASGNRDAWIGKGLAMRIRFLNGTYVSGPVASARVAGNGWHYDVF